MHATTVDRPIDKPDRAYLQYGDILESSGWNMEATFKKSFIEIKCIQMILWLKFFQKKYQKRKNL